jgi:DNA-binding NtrC family response regulator
VETRHEGKAAMNILIIDDKTFQIESLARGFKNKGHQVFSASSSTEAMHHLNNPAFPVDVIITDYVLSIKGSSELLRNIQENHQDLSVVMMTANSEAEGIANPLACISNAFLEKPFSLNQLLQLIEDCKKRQPTS